MILITRPKPEAKKLKRIIENLGYHTHIDSLSTIVNLKIDINSKPKKIILISIKIRINYLNLIQLKTYLKHLIVGL